MSTTAAQQDYKYPLTRVCLREGQMTLTRRLLEIFPAEGDVTLQDGETGDTIRAYMHNNRTVKGLGEFYKRHRLNVNDKLVFLQQESQLTVTPLRKVRQSDYSSPEAVHHVLNYIAENNTPLSEAEIRDIFPDLPITIELWALLKEDGRFVRREGRWRLAPATSPVREPVDIKIDEAVIANPFPFAEEEKNVKTEDSQLSNLSPIIKGSEWRKQHHIESDTNSGHVIDGVDARLGIEVGQENSVDVAPTHHHSVIPETAQSVPSQEQTDLPSSMHSFSLDVESLMAVKPDVVAVDVTENYDSSYAAVSDSESAVGSVEEQPAQSDIATLQDDGVFQDSDVSNDAVYSERADIIFPGDQGLSSVALEAEEVEVAQDLSQRAMWVLSQVGYQIEPITLLGQDTETQQLLAHARLGEDRGYSVLIHLHPSQTRLDWAGLLARRRETGADYLSVFGDAEDLQRLHSPAELARATLWSWKGLDRLESGSQALPLSPIDLEPYFSRYGMFEYGLEHFQKAIEQRISERGYVSTVLRRLAKFDAPCVFTLQDLQTESKPHISDGKLLEVVNTLRQPPFELVTKLDSGGYSLRQPIHQALTSLSDYANSLKAHILRQVSKDVAVVPSPQSRGVAQEHEASLNISSLSA